MTTPWIQTRASFQHRADETVLLVTIMGSGKSRVMVEDVIKIVNQARVAQLGNTVEFPVEIYALTHTLCEELRQRFIGEGFDPDRIRVLHGRMTVIGYDASGEPERACQRHERVRALEEKNVYAPGNAICQKYVAYKPGAVKQLERCPHWDVCPYQEERRGLDQVDIRLMAFAYTPLERSLDEDVKPYAVVVDEPDVLALVSSTNRRPISQLKQWLRDSPGLSLAPVREIVARMHGAGAKTAREALNDYGLRRARNVMDTLHEQLVASERRAVAGLVPSLSDSAFESEMRRVPRVPVHLRELVDALRRGAHDPADAMNDVYVAPWRDRDEQLVVAAYRPPQRVLRAPRRFLLDGTAPEGIYGRVFGKLNIRSGGDPVRKGVFIQAMDKQFGKRWAESNKSAALRLTALGTLLFQASGSRAGSVITHKSLEEELDLGAAMAELGHYGAIRGLDTHKDCAWAVQLGAPMMPVHDLEAAMRGLWPDVPLMLPGDYMPVRKHAVSRRPGAARPPGVNVQTHVDPRGRDLLEYQREGGLKQAIDRARWIHVADPTRLDLILTALPLPDFDVDGFGLADDVFPSFSVARLIMGLVRCGGVLPKANDAVVARTGLWDSQRSLRHWSGRMDETLERWRTRHHDALANALAAPTGTFGPHGYDGAMLDATVAMVLPWLLTGDPGVEVCRLAPVPVRTVSYRTRVSGSAAKAFTWCDTDALAAGRLSDLMGKRAVLC